MYNSPTGLSVSTPEYLAPEILDFLEHRQQRGSVEDLMSCMKPWSFDVWSLGTILLEILTGCPLWLSLKSRMVSNTGKNIIGMGLFGVAGRDGKKILNKQQQVFGNLNATLKKYDSSWLARDPEFMDLMSRMLDFNPMRRISPADILKHPFLTKK